jgi:hypothetical protein
MRTISFRELKVDRQQAASLILGVKSASNALKSLALGIEDACVLSDLS